MPTRKKIDKEVQKHILGYFGGVFTLSPGERARYGTQDHMKVLLKTAFDQQYIQGTARRLRDNWELPLPSGWTASIASCAVCDRSAAIPCLGRNMAPSARNNDGKRRTTQRAGARQIR